MPERRRFLAGPYTTVLFRVPPQESAEAYPCGFDRFPVSGLLQQRFEASAGYQETFLLLALPARGPGTEAVPRGERAFYDIGCASCHIPVSQTGPSTNPFFHLKPVQLFSDLLLHDIGTGDGIEQADAKAGEIRTPGIVGSAIR